jgi:pimeloyl-ACP methyl ester carboxylesterase
MTERKIKIADLEINYVEAGSGNPMLFLHNGGGFWYSWEHQLKHFSANYHVFGIDWPGFGGSDSPEGMISLQLLTDVLSEFIEKLNLENPILIGNCIGASAALNYTIQEKKSVRTLVLFNPCPGNLIFPFKPLRNLISSVHKSEKRKKSMQSFFRFLFTKTFVKRQFPKVLFGKKHDPSTPLYKRYLDKLKDERHTQSRVNMFFSVHTFNMDLITQNHKIPEHLLVWSKDNKVTLINRHGKVHRKLLKTTNYEVIENAGHLCMYERPEKVNQIIERYIAKTN